MSVTHSLYRFFDEAGALLYVGRTIDARSRWRTHERDKSWFDEVRRVEREVHPDAASLELAESKAIAAEAPRYNKQLLAPRVAADGRRPRVEPPRVGLIGLRKSHRMSRLSAAQCVAEIIGGHFTAHSLEAIEVGEVEASAEVLAAIEQVFGLGAGALQVDYKPSHSRRKTEAA